MKKYIYLFAFVFLLLAFGCSDWINVEPENSVTFENYFKTEKDLQAITYNMQHNLRKLSMDFAAETELVKHIGVAENELPVMSPPWDSEYATLESADLIIDNIHRFPLKKEVTEPYLLQAYFAKAMVYFLLATDYGNAVIVKESGKFDKYGNSTPSEVLDEAEKWALKAMDLPKYEDLKMVNPICKQYAGQGALQALLAKLYAWRAGVEGKEEYWDKAEECCTKIIDNMAGTYSLAKDPEEVCTTVLNGDSEEVIWELYQDKNECFNVADFYGKFGFLEGPSKMIGFPLIPGTDPNTFSTYIVTKKLVNEVFDHEDLRRAAYFWRTDAKEVAVKFENNEYVPVTEWEEKDSIVGCYDNEKIERAYLYKFRYPLLQKNDASIIPQYDGMMMPIIKYRLADIILLRAECRVRQGKRDGAIEDLNTIRKRAYGGISHNFPCADDVEKGLVEDLQLAIFREREKELFLEGHRYHDARRNGVDYVRKYCSHYSRLTDQDIEDGALYLAIPYTAFKNNDFVRQHTYWSKRLNY